jgi:hypothetical protein
MKKRFVAITLLLISLFAIGGGSVSAAPVEKVDGFVCPVLGGKAGQNQNTDNPNNPFIPIAGGWSIAGPNVDVPEQATNWGWPGGAHGKPKDPGYTAIWDLANFP